MCPRDGLCPSDAFATPDNHNTSVKTITYTTELCHASIEKYDILDSRGIVVLGRYNDVYRKTKPPSARRNSMPGWPVVQASCHPQSEPVCRAVVPQRETAAPARLADQSTATSPPGCRRSGDIDRLARADGLLMDVAHVRSITRTDNLVPTLSWPGHSPRRWFPRTYTSTIWSSPGTAPPASPFISSVAVDGWPGLVNDSVTGNGPLDELAGAGRRTVI